MKKLFAIIISIAAASSVNAQWDTLSTGSASNFNDLIFSSADTGYLAGNSGSAGILLSTTDKGNTWNEITLPAGLPAIHSIAIFNGKIFIAGDNGVLRSSADHGNSWDSLNSKSLGQLNKIFFVNDTGYLAGNSGEMRRSTNGGVTWDSVDTGTTQNINAIFFHDGLNGIIAGDGGTIRKTNDGGSSWTAVNNPFFGFLQAKAISFSNPSTGLITGGSGRILKTSDGGNTWTQVFSGVSTILNDVYYADTNNVFICGTSGTVLRSIDGGNSWHDGSVSFVTEDLNAIHFVNDTLGFACGENGRAIRTLTAAVGIDGNTDPLSVNVYPNPFSEKIKITCEIDTEYFICDISGKVISAGKTSNETEIDLSAADAGIYFLTFYGNKTQTTKKIIKQ